MMISRRSATDIFVLFELASATFPTFFVLFDLEAEQT